ncbi:uncharacterized protein N7479_011273 [Penicillium vulpinum]|uniref:uncharacterized protein n=1 Tax=Penicillium vulpinum TaxID=29845 RepID=UPI002546BB77|nr:uncharacterized protein N7479_011273 [Penicillium vulpinum]KAJ5952860.1 hypothetical protein N7479_011273 [Penicillium vulpinum]
MLDKTRLEGPEPKPDVAPHEKPKNASSVAQSHTSWGFRPTRAEEKANQNGSNQQRAVQSLKESQDITAFLIIFNKVDIHGKAWNQAEIHGSHGSGIRTDSENDDTIAYRDYVDLRIANPPRKGLSRL